MEVIGIAMATYNGAKYIEEMLDSIAAQSYKFFIIHICDDGSTDDTINLIKSHYLYINGKIIIHSQEGGNGAYKNFKRTLSFCNEKYISLCDQDDYWHKDKLRILLAEIKNRENSSFDKPVLIYSDLEIVNDKLEVLNSSFYDNSMKSSTAVKPQDFIVSNHIPGCAMFFNHALKKIFEPMPDAIRMHDWWICLVAASFGEIKFVNYKLIKYRQHSNNTVGAPGILKGSKSIYTIKSMLGLWRVLSRSRSFRFELIKKIRAMPNIYYDDNTRRLLRLNIFDRLYFMYSSKSGEISLLAFTIWLFL